MRRTPRILGPGRWAGVARQLLRWVDPGRADELRTHVEDAEAAGYPLGVRDAASVAQLAARTQLVRGCRQLPYLRDGIPIIFLCLMVQGFVYESLLAPWDLMEETPSADWRFSLARQVLDQAWILQLLLAALSGRRAVISVREGRPLLPAVYVAVLAALVALAITFEPRTVWVERGWFEEGDVDRISPYSLVLVGSALLVPALHLLIDGLIRRRNRGGPGRRALASPSTSRFDPVALGGLLVPCLFVSLWTVPPLFFLSLVWLTPKFRLREKVVATAVGVVFMFVGALVWVSGDGDTVGSKEVVGAAVLVTTWSWIAVHALRGPRFEPPAAIDKSAPLS